ncbi:flagellar hook protein FlgE [Acidithrix ferrooxidans]|uniref:Flagellar hook protein FlgE n=1 Tax=Acidithrix ferrooxidans TaxID=1280514 RepID=A0A0D8HHK1_9ACTN|nr:flagellar hook protein FlgE [Acidithrix ferrooxidans]KJF16556.1 flagellar hook protein FlgE [Acidithrix ferrooxidans]
MTRSLSAAISGIDAAQTMLDNVGNNIANVNTVGYQDTSVQFADLLNQQVAPAGAPQTGVTGGVNPIFVGSGVRVSSTSTNFTEGTNVQTGSPTDVAIQGTGFLVAQQNGQTYYTRAGNLKLDANGQLVTQTGALIQGWSPTTAGGTILTTGPTGPLSIPQGQAANPAATANITLGGNLPAWNGATVTTQPSYTATTTAYDSLGNQIPITVTFTATSGTADSYGVKVTTPTPGSTTGGTTSLGSGTITFVPTTGQMTSTTPIPLTGFPTSYSVPTAGMNLDFPAAGTTGAVTQFSGSSTIAVASQDGYPSGTLQNFSIGSDGTVTGTYANGKTQSLGVIAMANFANENGLTKVGNLNYQSTLNSGTAQLGTPGTGGRGQLLGGSLENSNVSLGTELSNLIVAQTAYQADTKVVSTTSMVLQSLVQM